MSVQTEIDRISTAVQNAHLKVIEKGGTSAAPYLVANLADAIDTIPEATALDELTNPGSADTMLEGTEMLNAEGKKVTGAIPVRSSSDLTASGSSVSIKEGYYPMGYMQSVAIATMRKPTISVDDQGIITASVNYPTGYVTGGNLSQLKNLTTKAASTITPTTANQTAVAKGRYTTGDVVVAGDANLVADNIKSGVSIFGVAGSYEGSGGSSGSGSVETCTVTLENSGLGVFGGTIYYVDEQGELQTTQDFPIAGGTVSMPKNQIIYVVGWSTMGTCSGQVSLVGYMMATAAFYVTGDCTLSFDE